MIISVTYSGIVSSNLEDKQMNGSATRGVLYKLLGGYVPLGLWNP